MGIFSGPQSTAGWEDRANYLSLCRNVNSHPREYQQCGHSNRGPNSGQGGAEQDGTLAQCPFVHGPITISQREVKG